MYIGDQFLMSGTVFMLMCDDQPASGQETQEPAQIVARSSLVTINWAQHSDLDPITGYKYVTLPHNIHAISNIQFLSSVVESIEFVYEYKCKEICR